MKKPIISNKRLVAGLIGLLFVVTFVQTIGILNISKSLYKVDTNSQKAQTISTGNACMQITPIMDFADTIENVGGTTNTETWFSMFYNIKNICSFNIYILNPESWPSGSSLQYSTLQTLTGQNSPTNVSTPNNSTYGTSLNAEFINCATCSVTPNYSSNMFSTGYVRSIVLQPGQTKTFTYNVSVVKSYAYQSNFLAVYPTLFKWFKQSALNDNNVLGSEIFTHTFTTDPARRSSFVR